MLPKDLICEIWVRRYTLPFGTGTEATCSADLIFVEMTPLALVVVLKPFASLLGTLGVRHPLPQSVRFCCFAAPKNVVHKSKLYRQLMIEPVLTGSKVV